MHSREVKLKKHSPSFFSVCFFSLFCHKPVGELKKHLKRPVAIRHLAQSDWLDVCTLTALQIANPSLHGIIRTNKQSIIYSHFIYSYLALLQPPPPPPLFFIFYVCFYSQYIHSHGNYCSAIGCVI